MTIQKSAIPYILQQILLLLLLVLPPVTRAELEDDLWAAINNKDTDAVDVLLGMTPAPDISKKPYLHLAIQSGSAALVERLLKAGANPNKRVSLTGGESRSKMKLPPLARAYGNVQGEAEYEIVKLLLEHGANPNGTDLARNGSEVIGAHTISVYALSFSNSKDATELVFSAGADPNATSYFDFMSTAQAQYAGMFTLHKKRRVFDQALSEGIWPELIDIMVKNGANIETEGSWKQALNSGNPDTIRGVYAVLKRRGKADQTLKDYMIKGVAKRKHEPEGWVELAQYLVSEGASGTSLNQFVYSPEHSIAMTSVLLSAGAEPNAAIDGYAGDGDFKKVELLLNNGADPSFGGALLVALGVNDFQSRDNDYLLTAYSLMRASANINVTNGDGVTPLLLASARLPDFALVLLKNGAQVDAVDKNGNTVLHYAIRGVQQGRKEVTQQALIQKYIELNDALAKVENASKETPLMQAASNGYVGLAEQLIPYSDINAQDAAGQTALLRAVKKAHGSVVKVLVRAGAKKDIKDDSGYDAIAYATVKAKDMLELLN